MYHLIMCLSPFIFPFLALMSQVAKYRKCHLYCRYENEVFTPGGLDQLRVFDFCGLRVGMLICMDIEYPEPARVLALQGMDVLLAPTALGGLPCEEK